MSQDTTASASAVIRGRPEYPSITEINVRAGSGTDTAILFQAIVGLTGLTILDVAVDNTNTTADNGKVFQWFKLTFPNGQVGWIRDDLLEVQGDLTGFGYPNVAAQTFAFALIRNPVEDTVSIPSKPTGKVETTGTPMQKAGPAIAGDTLERVKRAALAITAAFEGEGYAAYNNYDSGIISYGLIQFTLAAGTLHVVVEKYLARSNSATANGLRAYTDRIRAADASLRHDDQLKNLLKHAAEEPAMQSVQNELAISNYWDRLVDGFVTPRGYTLPLTYALLFDISVNFGVGDGFVRMAEERLDVVIRSRVPDNGAAEEEIIKIVADLRKISHDKQATRDNLPGLRVRGDFWVALVANGDWNLQGDAKGFVNVNGRPVQVRKP